MTLRRLLREAVFDKLGMASGWRRRGLKLAGTADAEGFEGLFGAWGGDERAPVRDVTVAWLPTDSRLGMP